MKKLIQAILFVGCFAVVGIAKAQDLASVCYGVFSSEIDDRMDQMKQGVDAGSKVAMTAEIEMYQYAMNEIAPDPQLIQKLNEDDRMYGQSNYLDPVVQRECGVAYLGGDGENPDQQQQPEHQFDPAVGYILASCAGVLDVARNYADSSAKAEGLNVVQKYFDAASKILGEGEARELYETTFEKVKYYPIERVMPDIKRCYSMGPQVNEVIGL